VDHSKKVIIIAADVVSAVTLVAVVVVTCIAAHRKREPRYKDGAVVISECLLYTDSGFGSAEELVREVTGTTTSCHISHCLMFSANGNNGCRSVLVWEEIRLIDTFSKAHLL
jgi:hypothetical protein